MSVDQVVDRLMAQCPDNPPRDLMRAMLELACQEGRVMAAGEMKEALGKVFGAGLSPQHEGKPDAP